jgi:hypothetical protein
MIFGLFVLGVALTISAVAAYYSIAGLCAIFAAAVTPIIIMGAALELGKITATVWLHKYWHKANIQFKLYLIPAIIILMLITSMGIFGFLSKAHMDQNITVGDSAAQVQILDEKIKTEQDNISVNKKALQQMDAQVDQMLGRTTDDKGANRAVQIRKNQAKERKSLQADITAAQKNISALQAERAPLAAQNRKIEAEVGPIKYIAALIYGDNPDANTLERAVRWVIILLVFVFDPLALILILAAEQTIAWSRKEREERKGWHQEWVPDSEAWPEWEADDGPLTNEQVDEINTQAGVKDVVMTEKLFDTEEEFFAHGKEVAQELDQQAEDRKPFDFSKHAYLNGPVSWFKSNTNEGWVPKSEPAVEEKIPEDFSPAEFVEEDPLDIPVLEGEEMWAQEAIDSIQYDPQPIRPVPPPADDPEPIVSGYVGSITIPDFSITDEEPTEAHAGFGTEFPIAPQRGDMFLRVDYLPSRLYKWNDKKWIEVDKEKTDQFAYDQMYIKHLIEKIDLGEYEIELLTEIEQEQIQRYLNDPTNK